MLMKFPIRTARVLMFSFKSHTPMPNQWSNSNNTSQQIFKHNNIHVHVLGIFHFTHLAINRGT